MKRALPSFVFIFILLNGLFLTVCFNFYWLPEGSTLAENFNALTLQEHRFKLKEQNRINIDTNKQTLDMLQTELDCGDLILLPFSELLLVLAKIRTMAEANGLTEIEFRTDEPVQIDTGALPVAILEASAVYQGDYENQLALVYDLLNSVCHVKTLDISKTENRMAVGFLLYGRME